jgi:sulfide:quinone oxidoreductase
MTQHNHSLSSLVASQVVIVGGGVAALEALLALRALAGDRVALTLVSEHEWFVDRPMTVAEPFGFGPAARHSLPDIAADVGAEFIRATVAAVDGAEHQIRCINGPDLAFDTLILAPGARSRPPFSRAITFGLQGSSEAIGEMLDKLRTGEAHSVAFVAPTMTGWLLPLYELALMTARELARSNVDGATLHLLSAEDRPLSLFGARSSQSVGHLMASAGIEFVRASFARGSDGGLTYAAFGESAPDYVVTLPLLHGPGLDGLPATEPDEFIEVDEYGRVIGLSDTYAAGDAVDFPVKQGGLAAQQADVVAQHVAARYGAPVRPVPFSPVLRGMVFTGSEPRFLRSAVPGADEEVAGTWYPLWWPPTKIAGTYLAPYLFGRTDENGIESHPEGFVDVDIPLTAATMPA